MKVQGSSGSGGARRTGASGAARGAGDAFRVDGAAGAGANAPASAAGEIASSSALGALIALQSEGRNHARNRAAAERALMLLDRLKEGIANGRITESDLAALSHAASAKLEQPDEKIAAIYEDIALRARVELAKLGR